MGDAGRVSLESQAVVEGKLNLSSRLCQSGVLTHSRSSSLSSRAGGAISVLMSQAGSQNGINDNWVWLIALSLSHSLKDLEALPGLRGGRSARITLSWMGVTSLKRKSENKHLVFTQLSPGERE